MKKADKRLEEMRKRRSHRRSLHSHDSLLELLDHIEVEFKKMTVQEMRHFIKNLRPEYKMYAGIQLLYRILDTNKDTDSEETRVARVVDFVIKARKILATGQIDEYDFEVDPADPKDTKYVLEHEDHVKKTSPLPLFPRRAFLRGGLQTVGCTALGAYFYANGLAAKAEQIDDCLRPDPEEEKDRKKKHRFTSFIREFLGETWGPPFELLLGIVCVNEGMEKWDELKYHQVSNSIAEFIQNAERKIEKDGQAAGITA